MSMSSGSNLIKAFSEKHVEHEAALKGSSNNGGALLASKLKKKSLKSRLLKSVNRKNPINQ
jgi:hypothetical protein